MFTFSRLRFRREAEDGQKQQGKAAVNRVVYRQGDILLIKQDHLPADAEPQESKPHRIVLAYGEATGHAHAIGTEFAKSYVVAGETFVDAKAGAVLVHEEHGQIRLEPGVYRVVRQREYAERKVRFVHD